MNLTQEQKHYAINRLYHATKDISFIILAEHGRSYDNVVSFLFTSGIDGNGTRTDGTSNNDAVNIFIACLFEELMEYAYSLHRAYYRYDVPYHYKGICSRRKVFYDFWKLIKYQDETLLHDYGTSFNELSNRVSETIKTYTDMERHLMLSLFTGYLCFANELFAFNPVSINGLNNDSTNMIHNNDTMMQNNLFS